MFTPSMPIQASNLVELLVAAFYDGHPIACKELFATDTQQCSYQWITSLFTMFSPISRIRLHSQLTRTCLGLFAIFQARG